jgi:hypothetical protein
LGKPIDRRPEGPDPNEELIGRGEQLGAELGDSEEQYDEGETPQKLTGAPGAEV